MSLMYKCDVLQLLKQGGFNTNKLRQNRLLSEGVIQSLREQKPISWSNIEKICSMLNCQPGDLIEYVSDDTDSR